MTTRPANVIPSREARQHLGTMLDRFRKGQTEPMIFGAHRRPEAVVLSFEEYMRLLDVVEEHRREEEFAQEVRARVARLDAEPDRAVSMSLEELVRELGPAAEAMLEEI